MEENIFTGLGGNEEKSPVETPVVNTTNNAATVDNNNPGVIQQDDISESSVRVPTPRHTIEVNLTDKSAPIVFLFGAKSSGKSMTLVRLAKYLRPKGYKLEVDANFCNIWEYKENRAKFNKMLDSQFAMPGTNYNDFLLIKILDARGNTICQILEGAGEDYFPKSIEGGTRSYIEFSQYMTVLFASSNKKVWMFITEPNWDENRNEYVDRIGYCKDRFFGNRDKCIIIYNKIDKTPFASGEKVNIKAAMRQCNNEYPGLFSKFPNNSPLPSFLKSPFSCKFVPFSTGSYSPAPIGANVPYTPSKDIYPHHLWESIMKCIKG